jgi:hypothetical protein
MTAQPRLPESRASETTGVGPADSEPTATGIPEKESTRHLIKLFRREWAELWGDEKNRQAIIVLISSLLLLVVFTLYGKPVFLRSRMIEAGELIGWPPQHAYFQQLPFLYWALTSVVLRLIIPVLIILLLIRGRTADFGFRIRGITPHAWTYALFFVVMIPIVLFASTTPAFQAKYPLFPGSAQGLNQFLVYQIAYGIQFLGVEGFFRGYMTFGLYPRFGYLSIFIMVIPYCMVHFGKPHAEVFMAIPAGLILGYLALKSRTWIFGALLHWTVAITMDLLAIWQKGGFGAPPS